MKVPPDDDFNDFDTAALAELTREAARLPAAVRAEVGEGWARDASFEHASIASFGRFALSLLAVGAPPELVQRAHVAALDEVRHARLSFALASAYAGEPLGPGPLPLGDQLAIDNDLASLACATLREGCLNETLAALEAAEALAHARPRAIRHALTVIEREERSHAALAFTFVGWASKVGGVPVQRALGQALRGLDDSMANNVAKEPASAWPSAPDPAGAAQRLAHGRLGSDRRARVRTTGYRDIVRPAITDLLGTASDPAQVTAD